MPYKEGQRIEVRMPVTVRTTVGSTSEVAEDNQGAVHYLDLSSDAAREEATGSLVRPSPGDRLTISFSARVAAKRGPLGTTRVTSAGGFEHFVYLESSKAVTAAARPAPGRKVRAKFTAKVTGGSGPSGTIRVEETTGLSKGTVHNLYVGDRSAREQILSGEYPASPLRTGDVVNVSFTAPVQPTSVTISDNFAQVRTESSSSSPSWTHFLDVDSLSVSVVPDEEATDAAVTPVAPARRAYLKGEKIRFTADVEILALEDGSLSTSRVREASGPGKGTIHYVYLASPGTRQEVLNITQRVAVGDRVRVRLTAALRKDESASSISTEVVSEKDYYHFLDLSSPSVTLATQEGETAPAATALTADQAKLLEALTPAASAPPAYEQGDEVRFEADVEVLRTSGGLSGCTTVRETRSGVLAGDGIRHLVYFGQDAASSRARTEILGPGQGKPRAGGKVRVSFTAKIADVIKGGPESTTKVVTPQGFTHYLFLDSPSVTPASPARKAEKEAALVKLAPGSKVRARFTAEVLGRGTSTLSTSRVREVGGAGDGRIHCLYLGAASRREILGGEYLASGPSAGDRIRVDLTALVEEGSPGDPATRVSTGGTWKHFLDTASPSVVLLPPEPATTPAAAAEAAVTPLAAAALTAGDVSPIVGEGIDSERLRELILAIEEASGYAVVRLRNDEVLFSAGSEAECRKYVDAEDYDPARVVVRASVPDKAAGERLALLKGFQDAVTSELSGAMTWEVKPDGYFTGDWAKDQALSRDWAGTLTPEYLDEEWPFTFVDWNAAAEDERDAICTPVTFNGVTFYGEAV